MGLFDRIRNALTGADAGQAGTSEPTPAGAGPTAPAGGIAAVRASPDGPPPKRTLPLFIHRASALTADQWRLIEGTWQSTMADPVRVVARAAAQERAEQLEAQTNRTVEMTSEVRVEFADERSRLLATASSRMRQRIATLESQLQARRLIMRDALVALSVRDVLGADDFDVLYGPFEAFILRAELELQAEDWGIAPPATETSVPQPGSPGDPVRPVTDAAEPAHLASPAESDPWRDVAWAGQPSARDGPPEDNEPREQGEPPFSDQEAH